MKNWTFDVSAEIPISRAFRDALDRAEDALVQPLLNFCWNLLLDAKLANLWEVEVDSAKLAGWMGGHFGGAWHCEGCGEPQVISSPWPEADGRKRCETCGPPAGYARCPAASHGKACPLCRGLRYVEEIA